MVAVPTATPEPTPPEVIVNTEVLLLVHVPAPVLVYVLGMPRQIAGFPPIGPGSGDILTVVVAIQPVGNK